MKELVMHVECANTRRVEEKKIDKSVDLSVIYRYISRYINDFIKISSILKPTRS